MKIKTTTVVIALSAAMALILGACSSDKTGDTKDSTPTVQQDTNQPQEPHAVIGHGTVAEDVDSIHNAAPLSIWYEWQLTDAEVTPEGAAVSIKYDWEEEEEMMEADAEMLADFAEDFADNLFSGYNDLQDELDDVEGDSKAYTMLANLCCALADENKSLELKLIKANGQQIKCGKILVTSKMINANKDN